jgi:UDP-N-acetyl-D-galactosamine dehydrogenase
MLFPNSDTRIAIIGLGYVGLPLAVELSKKYDVLGFDINSSRVEELKDGCDATLEVSSKELQIASSLRFSSDRNDLINANVYIVTVPTPIDDSNAPDLTPLQKASEMLGQYVGKGDVIIYESTVYPGATEEVCLPIIEKESGLKFNEDFFCRLFTRANQPWG